MSRVSLKTTAGPELAEDKVSLCSIVSGGELFGIDTKEVREVLDRRLVRRVPLSPSYISGLTPYRGEVLTTVSLRALLGQSKSEQHMSVLVLEDAERDERFGLTVDSVDGVRVVCRSTLADNPCTLENRIDAVFSGAYASPEGLIVHLDPRKLLPSRLAKTGF